MPERADQIRIAHVTPHRWREYRDLRVTSLETDPSAYSLSPEDITHYSRRDWQQRLKDALSGTNRRNWGAFVDNKLVGLASAYREPALKQRHIVTIWGVYVEEGFRGRGLATSMLKQLMEEFTGFGDVTKFQLEVETERRGAERIYAGLGFGAVGLRQQHLKVGGQYFDVFDMEKRVFS